MQLPWESCVKPVMHLCLGLHRKEPIVFSQTKPTPQLWVRSAHSLTSKEETDKHECNESSWRTKIIEWWEVHVCCGLPQAPTRTVDGTVAQAYVTSQPFKLSLWQCLTLGKNSPLIKNITCSNSAINRSGTKLLKWQLLNLMSDGWRLNGGFLLFVPQAHFSRVHVIFGPGRFVVRYTGVRSSFGFFSTNHHQRDWYPHITEQRSRLSFTQLIIFSPLLDGWLNITFIIQLHWLVLPGAKCWWHKSETELQCTRLPCSAASLGDYLVRYWTRASAQAQTSPLGPKKHQHKS